MECPQQHRGRPMESRRQLATNLKNHQWTTANHLVSGDGQDELSKAQKIAQLRQELQAADLQGAFFGEGMGHWSDSARLEGASRVTIATT